MNVILLFNNINVNLICKYFKASDPNLPTIVKK